MIVMMITPPIGHKAIAVVAEMKSARLRLSPQEGACRGAYVEESEDGDGPALLHHKFFCMELWG
jgi:hypothetical protein